jgi:ribokinase
MSEDEILGLPGAALVTYGKKGSKLHSNESIYTIQAIPTKVVDPTGAGDGYRAGFWAGKLRGYPMLAACRLGSIVSSFVVKKMGAQRNIPSWEDIVPIYNKYFGDLKHQ